jgi:uncharacterized protein
MKTDKITAEQLHALADGELSEPQQERILAALKHDPQARAMLNDIRHTKTLLKHAYPLSRGRPAVTAKHFRHFARIAAVLLLVTTGFGLGWQSAALQWQSEDGLDGSRNTIAVNKNKTIIYLGHSDLEKFRATLDTARQLLSRHPGPETEVYVVASAGGIDLMRKQTSPYQEEMASMMASGKALRFVACNNTIYRFREEGKPIDLVEGTDVAPSAVEFVVQHLRHGWQYVSI